MGRPRGRPPMQPGEQRNQIIRLTFNRSEYEAIERAAFANKLYPAEWVRRTLVRSLEDRGWIRNSASYMPAGQEDDERGPRPIDARREL